MLRPRPCPQANCYEDSRLLKLFPDMVKILYDTDVLGEDTIRFWWVPRSVLVQNKPWIADSRIII